MTPEQLAKSGSEHANQVAFFAYCAIAQHHGFAKADLWASGELKFLGKCTEEYSSNFLNKPTPATKPIPELKWIHAIHNQGHGDAVRGAKAKAEGVKAGVADIFWPYQTRNVRFFNKFAITFNGLYIEMKKPSEKPKKETSKGGLSAEQIEFKEFVLLNDYKWCVCYSWQEAVAALKEYLS